MSDVQEKSVLDLAVEEQERKNKEAEEAKQRKGTGSYEFEDVQTFALEDKKARVCRILGLPAEIRKDKGDAKFVLQSKVLSDDKKSYAKINWPIVEKDGKMIPDQNWILTKVLNKVREGKWVNYEDGHVDEKGKKGHFVKFHTETAVSKRVEGNSKPEEKFPPSFYPSMKVVMNVIDRYDSWCKENKHSKILVSRLSKFEGTKENGEKFEIAYSDTGIPYQCYSTITEHLRNCIGVKSLSDIDVVIVRDGKSTGNKYQCFDKSDYPKYFKDEAAFKIASSDSLTAEEKEFELYDLDKLYGVSSYSKIKRKLVALFKLCDAELGTSFEKELEELVKTESASRPQTSTKETVVNEDDNEEKYDSIDADSKPIEEKTRRAAKEETKIEITVENVKKLFPAFDKLTDADKKLLVDSIESIKDGVIPIYKKEANDALCSDKECVFVGTREPTSCPEKMSNCPVCGVAF
jgi:hypothetical protein